MLLSKFAMAENRKKSQSSMIKRHDDSRFQKRGLTKTGHQHLYYTQASSIGNQDMSELLLQQPSASISLAAAAKTDNARCKTQLASFFRAPTAGYNEKVPGEVTTMPEFEED